MLNIFLNNIVIIYSVSKILFLRCLLFAMVSSHEETNGTSCKIN